MCARAKRATLSLANLDIDVCVCAALTRASG